MPSPRDPAPLNALRDALASTADGAFVIGDDGHIRTWNRAAEGLLGFAAHEVVGRRCCDVFGGYDSEGNRLCSPACNVTTLVRMNEPVQHFDMRTRTKAGRPVWLNTSVLTSTTPSGERLTIHLFRDVTANKELLTLVHERLAASSNPEGPPAATALSRRELDVLRQMTLGHNSAAIAATLHVSRATVRNHAQSIFAKLGVHSRLEAVAYAVKHRLF